MSISKEAKREYDAAHKEDARQRKAAYYVAHRDEMLKRNRAYQAAHREELLAKKAAYYVSHKVPILAYQAAHKAERRARHIQNKYNLSAQEYFAMLLAQGGVCLICARAPTHKPLCVDHDHATGNVRGLLCHKCNALLGHAGDNPSVLASAIEYLKAKT